MAKLTVTAAAPSFSDKRVILVRTDDASCASFWDDSQVGHEQSYDGPTHLVIGKHGSEDALARMATRYGHTIEELRNFRDNTEPVPEDLRERFAQREAPTFELLRRCGDRRLWKSTTANNPPKAYHHITVGAELSSHHMPDLDRAMVNFELDCAELAHA